MFAGLVHQLQLRGIHNSVQVFSPVKGAKILFDAFDVAVGEVSYYVDSAPDRRVYLLGSNSTTLARLSD
jgi:hypothetical protein